MKYLCSSSIFELPPSFFSFQPDSQIAALYNMTADKQVVATEIYRLTTYWPKKASRRKTRKTSWPHNFIQLEHFNKSCSDYPPPLSFLPAEQRSGPLQTDLWLRSGPCSGITRGIIETAFSKWNLGHVPELTLPASSDDGKIKFYERFMKTLWNFNKSKSNTKPLFSLTE